MGLSMRFFSLLFLPLFALAGLAAAASLDREMSPVTKPGDILAVTFSITDMEVGKEVAIDEIIPEGFLIDDWSTEGAEDADYTVRENRHTWVFTASTENPSLTYTARVPDSLGSFSFNTVYMLPPAQINNLINTVTVREIVCGDGICDETYDTCPGDCPLPTQEEASEQEPEKGESGRINPWLWAFALLVIVFLVVLKRKRSLKGK